MNQQFLVSLFNQIKYQNARRAFEDSLSFIQLYPSFKPIQSYLKANKQGGTLPCICFDGSIPIVFQKKQYFTPVQIYLSPNYPDGPPLCFLKPLETMTIVPNHPNLSSTKIILPVLTKWTNKNTLTQVGSEMSSVFSDVPPLRAKPPPKSGNITTTTITPTKTTITPPITTKTTSPTTTTGKNNGKNGKNGKTDPKAWMNRATPQNYQQQYSTFISNQQYPRQYPQQFPQQYPQQYGQYSQQYPRQFPQQFPQQYPQQFGQYPQQFPQQYSQQYGQYSQQFPNPNQAVVANLNSQKVKKKMSLQDMKKKMRKKVRRSLTPILQEIESLDNQARQVEKDKEKEAQTISKLAEQIERTNYEQQQTTTEIEKIDTEIQQIQFENQQLQQEFDIDQQTTSNDIPFEQFQDLTAKQSSIDDTIFYLNYFLKNNKISIEEYLKHLRSLSQSLYLKRMHSQKVKSAISQF